MHLCRIRGARNARIGARLRDLATSAPLDPLIRRKIRNAAPGESALWSLTRIFLGWNSAAPAAYLGSEREVDGGCPRTEQVDGSRHRA
eukprot:14401219-Alexandrium_andersonii.AAC.1